MPAVPLFSSLLLLQLLHELQQSWIWDGNLNTAGTSRIPEAARSEIEPKAWCRSIMMSSVMMMMMKTQKLFTHNTLTLSLSLSLSLPLSLPKFKTRKNASQKILQLLYKSAQVCSPSPSFQSYEFLHYGTNMSTTNFPFDWPCLQGPQGFCV
jgi:hypothetical protein